MITDQDLLHQYADHGDEAAFAEVVRRQTDLVYSVAWRVTGNGVLAQDVTQGVFIHLARQAARLRHYDTLIGWLHTTARYSAIDLIRGEERRRAREQEACLMQNDATTPEVNWAAISPLLDDAVGQLREEDRKAVLLRFFQNLSHREIGAILGLSENSANKRIERALEKLRDYFSRRGITVSTTLLATAMAENSVQAAPVGLAASVTGPSLAAAEFTTGGLFLKFFLMSTKTKFLTAAVILVIAVIVTLSWPHTIQPPNLPLRATTALSIASQRRELVAVAQVAPPVLPAVNPSKPSVPTSADLPANFDPRAEQAKAELRSNLNFVIQTESRFIPPGGSGDFYGEHMGAMLRFSSYLDATPELNAAGDLATYTTTDETLAKIRAALVDAGAKTWLKFLDDGRISHKNHFVKVEGKWYMASQEGVPLMDDKGNSYAGNPTGDAFGKK